VRSELVDDLEDASENEILFRMNNAIRRFRCFSPERANRRDETGGTNPGNIDRYITDHAARFALPSRPMA